MNKMAGGKQALILVAISGVISGSAGAADTALSTTLSAPQAQARQLGIFFGGTASQYDLCVKKGFLAKTDRSAEDTAAAILEKMRTVDQGPDQSAFVKEGWDMMKKEIAEHESFYTQERCTSVGKEWTKILGSLRKN